MALGKNGHEGVDWVELPQMIYVNMLEISVLLNKGIS
jgi:hypothetical protein